MRIERIETFILKAPLAGGQRFLSSQGIFQQRTSLLVRITTDAGLSGWGEGGVSMPVEHIQTYLHEVLASRLLGRDPEATEPIWHELYGFARDYGRKGACVAAISGVDIALWDLRGRAARRPVHALLGGGFRDRLRAYATGLYFTEADLADPAGAAGRVRDEVQRYVAQGFTAIKGKIGLLSLSDDIRRLEALREAAGDRVLVMADANHAYTFASAVKVGQVMDRLDFHWFEEPLVPEDIHGYAELRRKLATPLAAGEGECTRYGMLELLRADAVDILQPDLALSGGLSEGQKIAALAGAFQRAVCCHVWGSGVVVAAALQLAATIPPLPYTYRPLAPENEPLFEFDRTHNPLRDDLVQGGFVLDGESVAVPQGPGLGIDIDSEVLEHFCVDRRTTGN
jgi:D-galactarolactone cycloisomerase